MVTLDTVRESSNSPVGEIASIDRGWLLELLHPLYPLTLVGEIASIDRGWLPADVEELEVGHGGRRRNSLD